MQPNHHSTVIVIMARASLWRDALESYLMAQPGVEVRVAGKNLGEMFQLIDHAAPQTLLLLEAVLCKDALVCSLERLRSSYGRLNCILIVDTPEQYRAAVEAGADRVVMKSMLHNQLDEILFIRNQKEVN